MIDQKKLIKESFDVFHIGHDSETTCTKKPQFEFVKSQNLAYGDLVGLLDASNTNNIKPSHIIIFLQTFKVRKKKSK